MSGPKVVNLEALRRRRQRESIARLRELRDTIAEWRNACENAGLLRQDLVTETERTLQRLDSMRLAENWDGLLTELAARLEFFRDGINNARQQAINRIATARERRRRLVLAVTTLKREWIGLGQPVPTELERVAAAAETADDIELANLESLVQQALSNLPARQTEEVSSARQQELSAALRGADAGPKTIVEWLAARAGDNPAKNDRLSRALAELEAASFDASSLIEKARRIALETDPQRRALLTDSVLLEADELCRAIRAREKSARSLRETIAALEPFQFAQADAWRERLTAALGNPDPAAATALAKAAATWIAEEAEREDAALRRQTVLKGLAALGYEVREGMAVAWAENGRIVVRKPTEPNYGVELASPATSAAVQARVVAFERENTAATARRDREVETAWCAEFARLREFIAEEGFTQTIQHAIPAGEVPLKIVEKDAPRRCDEQRRPPLKQVLKPPSA